MNPIGGGSGISGSAQKKKNELIRSNVESGSAKAANSKNKNFYFFNKDLLNDSIINSSHSSSSNDLNDESIAEERDTS